MSIEKEKWINEIERQLENNIPRTSLTPQFKKEMTDRLISRFGQRRHLSLFATLAIAASFAFLLSANIWMYLEHRGIQEETHSDYSAIHNAYPIVPTAFGKLEIEYL